MEEKDLIRLSQEGNGEAFSRLVERYKTKVYQIAYGLIRDQATADDLAQEIFIKAYYALPQFKFKASLGTWLYRIAVNHIKDYLRKMRKRRKEISLHKVEERVFLGEDSQLRKAEAVEDRRKDLVRSAFRLLPEKHQLILALRDIQGLSYEEISRILKLSPGTVDSRLHRARKKLREIVISAAGGGR